MKIKKILNIGIAGVFLIVVATVLMIVFRGGAGDRSFSKLPELGEVPDFSLTTSDGADLRREKLLGKVWIASFIFTRCAEICPMMMRQEVQLQGQLPVRDDLRLVSFSVDPDYDTTEVLSRYADTFGADTRRWLFLTGERKQIYRLAIEGLRLSVEDADLEKEMPILHSTKLVLVDRRGVVRGYYDTVSDVELQKLVRDVRKVLAEKN